VYRRGHLHFSDSQTTAVYFFWFSLSLAFWAAQGLYARAFYAAGNTLTPMIASSVITIASLAVYSALFREFSTVGLVMASDLGIAANCLGIAFLLHRRGLVPANRLAWKEIGKAFLIAAVAGLLGLQVARLVGVHGRRADDIKALAAISLTWIVVVALGLWLTRSELPRDLLRRKKPDAAARTS
jgi:putative peptidoglycan lipid II flippase